MDSLNAENFLTQFYLTNGTKDPIYRCRGMGDERSLKLGLEYEKALKLRLEYQNNSKPLLLKSSRTKNAPVGLFHASKRPPVQTFWSLRYLTA